MKKNNTTQELPVVTFDSSVGFKHLPDGPQWINRFEIKSETSSNVYIVSQNKKKRHWGCSCKGWIFHGHCKHLEALGLPGHRIPFEPTVEVIEDKPETLREQVVRLFWNEGKTIPQIAKKLSLGQGTVRNVVNDTVCL